MSLLHDLAESIIGDLTPEQISKQKKESLENEAMEKILSVLPKKLREEYYKIWNDYISKNSKESSLLHEIDKLEMALQAKKYSELEKSKEKLKPFFDSAKKEIKNKQLVEFLSEIMK